MNRSFCVRRKDIQSEIMEMDNFDFHGTSNDSEFGKPIFTINSGNLTHW